MTIEVSVKDKKGEIVDYRIINAVFPVIIADFSKNPLILEHSHADEVKLLMGYELRPIVSIQKRII